MRMTDLNAFRTQARAWLEANAPPALRGASFSFAGGTWGGRRPRFPHPDSQRWMEAMAERGWTAPTWPAEYGGGGLGKAEARALDEELRALGLPQPLVGLGLVMVGPTLLQFGDEAQKRTHIPRIVRGEIRWCQGYSEPGAGSDLASLSTRGVIDVDDLVVTGQKIWTSYADLSDWIFALVRTQPGSRRQNGVSLVLIDLQSPGVTVRPIRLISGASSFCETFFDSVRVPLANVVGPLHGGWEAAKALLGHERDIWGGEGPSTKRREGLADFARRQLQDSGPTLSDHGVRDRIAQLEMDGLCLSLTARRFREEARSGRGPGAETSLFKHQGAEISKRRFELMMELAGPGAIEWDEKADGHEMTDLARAWLRSRANSIEGGTSETQLNIIAKRVLGLPSGAAS
jgi:acyl-CoA dehydrogenase